MTARRILAALLPLLPLLALLGTGTAHAASTAAPHRAVIVIPGYGGHLDSPTGLPVQNALEAAGYDVFVGNDGQMTGAFLDAAHHLIDQGQALLDAGYTSVDLVGYSAGGLAARTAVTVDRSRNQRTFRTAVAVGSPLAGTDLAALGPGWDCSQPACTQMRPGSAFLASLPPLPTGPRATRFVSLWSQDDLVIVPVTSSVLRGALNVRIQAACPGVRGIWTGHEHLATSPAYTDLTVQAITGQADPATSPYRCALPDA